MASSARSPEIELLACPRCKGGLVAALGTAWRERAITEGELAEWTAAPFEPASRPSAVGDARAPHLILELERRP